MATTTAPRGSETIGNDLTVRDVLARDLSQRIEPVVKVYDRGNLAEDLRQFVITYFGPKSLLAISGDLSLESPGDLLRASERRTVSEFQALRLGLPGYRHAILEHCDREWAAQEKQAGVANDADGQKRVQPRAKVFRLNMRERLSGKRFVTPAEFDAVWKALGDEIVAKLKDGFEVVID
jgi:hypothetical protein